MSIRFRHIIVIGFFLLPVLHTCIAQDTSYFVEKLTTEEGLSSNNIIDMLQDDNGFLWIATTDGLNRFDGTQVTTFFSHNDSQSIPHNYVYCLEKIPGNILAIGTQAGLCFYNGNTGQFRNFYYAKNDSLDEYTNTILHLQLDTKGNLWAGSRNCIFLFDPGLRLKKVFPSPFTPGDASRLRLKFVDKILPMPDGYVLLHLFNGWYIYSPVSGQYNRVEHSAYKKQLSFLGDIRGWPLVTGEAESSSLVFKVFDKFFFYIVPGKDSLKLADEDGHYKNACSFPFNKYPYILWSQQVVMLDSSRLLFLFHNYGLAIIPVTWRDNRPVLHEPSRLLFEASEYRTALRDRQGNWWLGSTEEGMQKISPGKQQFKKITLINGKAGAPTKYEIVYTLRDRNLLWVGTYGDGFFEIDLFSGRQRQHRLRNIDNREWPNFIWNIRRAGNDTLWLGTQAGLFWYRISTENYGRVTNPGKPPAIDSVAITVQFTDSHGLVWMGLGRGNGVCYFDTHKNRFTHYPSNSPGGYPLRYPTAMAEDASGNIWFVNDASDILLYWNRTTDHFQSVRLPWVNTRQGSNLTGLLYDKDDSTLWLGTITSGLVRYRLSTGSTVVYGHEKGLVNSHISNIYKDRLNRLWLVTDGGLSCFDPTTEMFTNFSPKDGLPVRYPTASFYEEENGVRLYNGGHGALFYFDPLKMNITHQPQRTIITLLEVNGKPYMPDSTRSVKLNANQNDITVFYAAIDLANGPQTNYVYKLVGEDTGWKKAGKQRQLNFSNLAPGNYTFIVRGENSIGIGSGEEASLHFSIRPPFTQTGWFYALIIVLMGIMFYTLYRFRMGQLKRTEHMRSEISRNLHDEVGSTLTNISLGSLLAQKHLQDKGPVNKLLERIYQDSQTVSQTMREIVWSINPRIDTLGEALPRMLQYASESLEAKDIELQAEIDPAIDKVKFTMEARRDLYLVFKEAVNNLARHSGAQKAGIRFHLSGTMLTMTIWDDGTGFNTPETPTSNGLKNMQERAHKHHWRLTIRSAPGDGTSLELQAAIA